jgi:LAS superfamily LD-carboxypeptidase LdcB
MIPRSKTKIKTSLLTLLLMVALYFITIFINIKRIAWKNDDMLAQLKPNASEKLSSFIKKIESTSTWKVEIISGLRSKERQAELKNENKKNASPDNSKHVRGLAIDINLYKPFDFEKLKKSSAKADWTSTGIREIATEFGLEWGGDYKSYHDPVHLELQ